MTTGLYVQRLNSGAIHSVQVVDSANNSRPMDPHTYTARGIQPPIEQLPDMEHYDAAIPAPTIAPIILALADWVNRKPVSAEVLYRLQQFSFIYPDASGTHQLTPSGKQTLDEHGLYPSGQN